MLKTKKKYYLQGLLMVIFGASSYGILATVVSLGYHEGYNVYEIVSSQYSIGLFVILLINLIILKNKQISWGTNIEKIKLISSGIPLGLTGLFYYYAVQYLNVSIAIILLMQSIWMGVLWEAIKIKKTPAPHKLIGTLMIIIGTVLATKLNVQTHIDIYGLLFGFASALSYTATVITSERVVLNLHFLRRSLWMMVGAVLILLCLCIPYLNQSYHINIIWSWGILLAIFGTIIPPLMFTKGMPRIGVGMGSIIASFEIPISILCAHLILKEAVSLSQIIGIGLMLIAVVVINIIKE